MSEDKKDVKKGTFNFGKGFFKIKILLFCIGFVVLGAAVYAGLEGFGKFRERKVYSTYSNVRSEIQKVAEITVIKNHYSNIAAVKAEVMGGLSKAYNIVKYSGVVRIGLQDVSAIDVNVIDENKVVVHVPHAVILDNTITALENFDERRGLFVTVDTQLVFDEIKVSQEETLKLLIEDGILTDADAQLKAVITGMLSSLKFTEIEFKWK